MAGRTRGLWDSQNVSGISLVTMTYDQRAEMHGTHVFVLSSQLSFALQWFIRSAGPQKPPVRSAPVPKWNWASSRIASTLSLSSYTCAFYSVPGIIRSGSRPCGSQTLKRDAVPCLSQKRKKIKIYWQWINIKLIACTAS